MNDAIYKQAFESEVLDPKEHGLLVREIESVARRAGIPIQMVWTSMKKFCTDDEVSYVRELRKKMKGGVLGLVYFGDVSGAQIIDRMSAVAAACVRNYINAQVMQVNDVIRETQAGTMPMPTVLLIPNFYIGDDNEIPKWRSNALLDMLYTRKQEGLQTFLYVRSMKGLESDYGDMFVDHLRRFDQTPA
jgi:hypothetical protein